MQAFRGVYDAELLHLREGWLARWITSTVQSNLYTTTNYSPGFVVLVYSFWL